MPPRCSACPAAEASAEPRADALTALPHALTLRIWGALPPDARLRCREVCLAWRDALAEPRAWAELDLTAASGVAAAVTPALLRAAAARAGGHLERLAVTYGYALEAELLAVLRTNTDTLRFLYFAGRSAVLFPRALMPFQVVLNAAPRQCVVEAEVSVAVADAGRMLLRNEPPFQALRMRSFEVNGYHGMPAADASALALLLPAHPSLRELALLGTTLDTFAALDAVVDAALALRLSKLELSSCSIGPESAVALPRLLRGDALRELSVHGHDFTQLGAPAAALLADALRSNRTLTSLTLRGVGLWSDADAGGASLLSALVGHASLARIILSGRVAEDVAAVAGALLGALVAAESALRVLATSYLLRDANQPGPPGGRAAAQHAPARVGL